MSGDKLQLNPAYQRVDLIDQKDKLRTKAQKGNKQLKSLIERDKGQDLMSIQQQPLFVEQVDHNIEQVGIMAIREVRYVTEREWEKMIAMQKNQQEIMNYLDQISKFQKRHVIASRIPRNEKGQFASKEPGKEKQIKAVGRKGRPRKNEREH